MDISLGFASVSIPTLEHQDDYEKWAMVLEYCLKALHLWRHIDGSKPRPNNASLPENARDRCHELQDDWDAEDAQVCLMLRPTLGHKFLRNVETSTFGHRMPAKTIWDYVEANIEFQGSGPLASKSRHMAVTLMKLHISQFKDIDEYCKAFNKQAEQTIGPEGTNEILEAIAARAFLKGFSGMDAWEKYSASTKIEDLPDTCHVLHTVIGSAHEYAKGELVMRNWD